MTAASYNFYGTPSYQHNLAKLNREERRVLGSLLVDTNAAEAQMKRELALMELGGREKATERGLNLEEKRIEQKGALTREELASTVALRGKELAQKGELTRADMETNKNIAMSKLTSNVGIEERKMDFAESQKPWALGLGLTNVAASGALGYAKMNRDIETAELNRKMYESIYNRPIATASDWRKIIDGV